MFREGHIYQAHRDGYTVKVECVSRTPKQGTFRCSERDVAYLGVKRAKFVKPISDMAITDLDGNPREAVLSVGDGWYISDKEASASRNK